MMRLANRPVWGPAVSSSGLALLELAESAPAPALSAGLFVPVGDSNGPGLGFLEAQAPIPNAATNIRTIATFRIPSPPFRRSRGTAWNSLSEWAPDGFPDFALIRLQTQPGETVDRDRRELPSAALLLGVDQSCAIRRKARGLIQVPLRQHSHVAVIQILNSHPIAATLQGHHGQQRAVR